MQVLSLSMRVWSLLLLSIDFTKCLEYRQINVRIYISLCTRRAGLGLGKSIVFSGLAQVVRHWVGHLESNGP